MKKIVGTIAAAALVAASAFADVGIGSWGRAIWNPVSYNDADGTYNSIVGTSWADGMSRVGITVHGESENVGFAIDMNADGFSSAGIHDIAHLWAKPWSWLEMKIGKTQDDTGRGNICYGMFEWKRLGAGFVGEDVTFTRFGNGGGGQARGAILKVTPIEGLWAIASFDLFDDKGGKFREAANVFGNHAQYGVGYDIAGVGSVRAQYIGGDNVTNGDGDLLATSKLNAAFDLTAVENLYLTVGAYIPLNFKAAGISGKKDDVFVLDINQDSGVVNSKKDGAAKGSFSVPQVKIAAGVSYKLNMVTLSGFFAGYLPNLAPISKGADVLAHFACEAGVGASFDFGNGIGAVVDVRYASAKKYTATIAGTSGTWGTNDMDKEGAFVGDEVSFLVGVSKSLTNGSIGIGFEGDFQTCFTDPSKSSTSASRFNWYVPIVITAWF